METATEYIYHCESCGEYQHVPKRIPNTWSPVIITRDNLKVKKEK